MYVISWHDLVLTILFIVMRCFVEKYDNIHVVIHNSSFPLGSYELAIHRSQQVLGLLPQIRKAIFLGQLLQIRNAKYRRMLKFCLIVCDKIL